MRPYWADADALLELADELGVEPDVIDPFIDWDGTPIEYGNIDTVWMTPFGDDGFEDEGEGDL